MQNVGHYVRNEQGYKDLAYEALNGQFVDRSEFDAFYHQLQSDHRKDDFLRVASFYLFLVKRGDWHVRVEGVDEVVDYLTNSFKLVALFSLIESLTDLKHQDFFEWLSSQDPSNVFPIKDSETLRKLHEKYKASYGAIRRCVAFFERLPQERKKYLGNAVYVGGSPLESIQKLAQHLYTLRSKFVHEAVLVLTLSDRPVLSLEKKGKLVQTNLPLPALMETFEEGVLAYFKHWI